MHVGIYSKDAPEGSVKRVKAALDEAGVRFTLLGARRPRAGGVDCVVVMGGDKGVRRYFHRTFDSTIPVLGLHEAESSGFLAQIDSKELPAHAGRLRGGDYAVEEVPRLGVKIDGRSVYPVLNDVAVFPSKSAMLMEHTLRVNGQEVWHDSSDGVILSTPMGSSAYSMSAGGPVVFQDSAVFEIISVNSLDVTRRPIIVPDGSSVDVEEISSRLHCEAVLDGIDRCAVRGSVSCAKFAPYARIVRLRKATAAISALARKVHLAEELLSMPPSSKLILKTLEYEGQLTQRDLVRKTMLPDRTVRLALRHLLERRYVRRRVSARDARQKIYEISGIG